MHKENRVSLIDCELTEKSVDTVHKKKFALVLINAQPVSTACRVREATTVNYLCSFSFHQEWGATEVTTAINRVVSINKAKSIFLLILGMSSREGGEEATRHVQKCHIQANHTGDANRGGWQVKHNSCHSVVYVVVEYNWPLLIMPEVFCIMLCHQFLEK